MRTMHSNRRRLGSALAALAVLVALTLPALAAELTVESYVDLTIDRLELARTTWSEEGRSPVETEEAAICQLYETTLDAYYRFAGEHRKEIEDYLAQNTEKRDTIDALAAEIKSLIDQVEASQ
jgi:predicted NACHT family NTPase